jgi:hypothetical protein
LRFHEAVSLVRRSDQELCRQHTGAQGGQRAARLRAAALLEEVSNALRDPQAGRRAAEDDGSGVTSPVVSKGTFTLLSVAGGGAVMQVLSALGVFGCKRPPLASHVAFERWRGGQGPDVGETWWRIVVNGVDLSSKVPGCELAAGGAARGCPEAAIEELWHNWTRPGGSWSEACAAND